MRQGLALGEPRQRPVYSFRLKTVEGRLLPGVDLADRDKLFDLLDRGKRALEHGVHEILTLDGDFARFPQPSSRNPFL